jgi:hypothetical protein
MDDMIQRVLKGAHEDVLPNRRVSRRSASSTRTATF